MERIPTRRHKALPALQDALDAVVDVREYDVPFHMRAAIDTGIRCGYWYTVKVTVGCPLLWHQAEASTPALPLQSVGPSLIWPAEAACSQGGHATLEHRADLVQRADVRICAFDIETTKLPLQFPNAEFDQVRPSWCSCGDMPRGAG